MVVYLQPFYSFWDSILEVKLESYRSKSKELLKTE